MVSREKESDRQRALYDLEQSSALRGAAAQVAREREKQKGGSNDDDDQTQQQQRARGRRRSNHARARPLLCFGTIEGSSPAQCRQTLTSFIRSSNAGGSLRAIIMSLQLTPSILLCCGFQNHRGPRHVMATAMVKISPAAAGLQPAPSRPEANRQPHGSSNVSNPRLVGRKKPYANRIRESSAKS